MGGIVALSPDDAWLAVSGAITIWDLRRRELLLALPEEKSVNWALAWSPDRQRLAAGFSDGSLVIWNIPRIRAQLAQIGLNWLLIRMRSGWIPTRKVARISVRNCTHISTTNGTASRHGRGGELHGSNGRYLVSSGFAHSGDGPRAVRLVFLTGRLLVL